MLAMGKRPGTAQGLAAAKQASGLGYASRASIALTDLSNRYYTSSASQTELLIMPHVARCTLLYASVLRLKGPGRSKEACILVPRHSQG